METTKKPTQFILALLRKKNYATRGNTCIMILKQHECT